MTANSFEPAADLEARLAAATACDAAPAAWQAALASQRPALLHSRLVRPVPNTVLGIAGLLVLCVCIIAITLPSLGKARSAAHLVGTPVASAPVGTPASNSVLAPQNDEMSFEYRVAPESASKGGFASQPSSPPVPPRPGSSAGRVEASTERHVVRKASIEIRTPDIRALAARAQLLVNEAAGEFIEESSISGEDQATWAQLTLRVASSRLSEVLTQLRAMGKVISETAGGQDVTDQVVDLEARLRNEQQVEQELLHLLATRDAAPLKEILELREHISSVREQIERLTAQRDRLSRLTSLATVVVIVRHEWVAKPESDDPGWWSHLRDRISSAATSGLHALTDAIAFLVWAFVGGLIWWILLAAAIITMLRLRRAALRRRAIEPPPAI